VKTTSTVFSGGVCIFWEVTPGESRVRVNVKGFHLLWGMEGGIRGVAKNEKEGNWNI